VAYSVQGAGKLLKLLGGGGGRPKESFVRRFRERTFAEVVGVPRRRRVAEKANFTRASRHVAAAFAPPIVSTQLCRRDGADAVAAAVDDLSRYS